MLSGTQTITQKCRSCKLTEKEWINLLWNFFNLLINQNVNPHKSRYPELEAGLMINVAIRSPSFPGTGITKGPNANKQVLIQQNFTFLSEVLFKYEINLKYTTHYFRPPVTGQPKPSYKRIISDYGPVIPPSSRLYDPIRKQLVDRISTPAYTKTVEIVEATPLVQYEDPDVTGLNELETQILRARYKNFLTAMTNSLYVVNQMIPYACAVASWNEKLTFRNDTDIQVMMQGFFPPYDKLV